MNKLLVVLTLLISGYGCNSANDEVQMRTNEKDSADKMISYSDENVRMNKAISEAKESFSTFLGVLENPCDGCSMFLVKMKFEEDGAIEHMWVDSLHLRDGSLFGNLSSVPESIKRIALGDRVEVKKDSLSDWMYVQNRRLIGGYTLKVIYDDLRPEEKKQMEVDIGARIRD